MKRFTKVTIKPLKVLRERRINGKRHWENHKGHIFPSVTTVLSILDKSWLKDWHDRLGHEVAEKVKKEINIDKDVYDSITKHSGQKTGNSVSAKSMIIGTKAHKIIENYLNNKKLDFIIMGLYEKAHFLNIQDEIEKIDRIRVLEANLFSETLGIAGRVDIVADYCGKKSVIDIKTASRLKDDFTGYKLQVTAYTVMYNELQNDNIEQGVILLSSADGGKQVVVFKIKDYIEQLKQVIHLYKKQLLENTTR